MNYDYLAYKDNWEQARLIAYMVAQTNSTKKLKVTDILEFSWDKKEEDTSISNDDVKRLQERARQYEQNFKQENNG